MNKVFLLLLFIFLIGDANAGINVTDADIVWNAKIVAGPNPPISNRIVFDNINTVYQQGLSISPDLSSGVNTIIDRIIFDNINTVNKQGLSISPDLSSGVNTIIDRIIFDNINTIKVNTLLYTPSSTGDAKASICK